MQRTTWPTIPGHSPFYVHDLLIIGPKGSAQISKLEAALGMRSEMTDIGLYLAMSITRDRTNKVLHMSQESYVEKILESFNMTDRKAAPTPMDIGTNLGLVPDRLLLQRSRCSKPWWVASSIWLTVHAWTSSML